MWKQILFGLFLVVCIVAHNHDDGLLLTIEDGLIQGYVSAQGTHKVWHLPYAAPPVGANRWRSPQPVSRWGNNVYNASAIPPICPQTGLWGSFLPNSEDCLYLFVWVPLGHTIKNPRLPVQIYIPGGDFVSGAGQYYTGDIPPGNDYIYVSVSYRLGTLGFFSHPALFNSPAHKDGAGFYGIQDQRAAFKWVHDNIERFGGDNKRVTISGESSGGGSVCIHLAAPKSAGLFQQAIMQSAGCDINELDAEKTKSSLLATEFGCNGATDAEMLNCLMNAPVATILASDEASYPALSEISEQPTVILARGDGVRVPLLIGTNTDEGTLATCPNPDLRNLTSETYEFLVREQFPQIADLILAAYPASAYDSPSDALANILADYEIKCAAQLLANIYSIFPASPTYMYSYNHVPSYFAVDEVIQTLFGNPNLTAECFGVAHTYELALQFTLFDSLVAPLGLKLTAEELVLRETMRKAWSDFIVTGKPSLPNMAWPLYNSAATPFIEIDLTISEEQNFRGGVCNLWNAGVEINPVHNSAASALSFSFVYLFACAISVFML